MRYITYNLIWNNGIGDQPYTTLSQYGVSFNGGVIEKDSVYFGYMNGTDAQCVSAISGSVAYNMKELDGTHALQFFSDSIPLNTVQTDLLSGVTLYAGNPFIAEDQTITIPWTETKN